MAKISPAWIRPVRRRHSPSPAPAPFLPEHIAPVFPNTPMKASTSTMAGLSNESPILGSTYIPLNGPPTGTSRMTPSTSTGILPGGLKPRNSCDFTFSSDDFRQTQASFGDLHNEDPVDPMFFPGNEFFDLASAASPPSPPPAAGGMRPGGSGTARVSPSIASVGGFSSFGDPATRMFDDDLSSEFPVYEGLKDLGLPSSGMDGLIPGGAGNETL